MEEVQNSAPHRDPGAGKLLACDTLPDLLKLLDATIRLTVANPPEGFTERLTGIPGVKRVDSSNGFAITVDDASAAP